MENQKISNSYPIKDYRMIPVCLIQEVVKDFYENHNCGESWLEYKDRIYRTDIGYAFDGVFMILDVLEKELNIKLIPDEVR